MSVNYRPSDGCCTECGERLKVLGGTDPYCPNGCLPAHPTPTRGESDE